MIRPDVLKPLPAQLTSALGAVNAAILYTALLNVGPAIGVEYVDVARLLGGLFVSHPTAVFWLGYAVYFFVGISVFPPVVVQLWLMLPGRPLGFRAAVLKGIASGLGIWTVTGLLLPVLEVIGGAGVDATYGLFAVSASIGTALWFLASHVAYGVALTLVAIMTNGMKPIDTLGWNSHRHGDVREAALGLPHPGGKGIFIGTKPW